MKGSVLALTGTTVALALACVALLQQAQTERKRAQAEAILRHQWEVRVAELMGERSTPPAISSPPAKLRSGAQRDPASPVQRQDERQLASSYWARFLNRLATPDGHAQLLAKQMLDDRWLFPDLAKALHLTHEQENQVLAAEAEQMLQDQARMVRCRLDSTCDPRSALSRDPGSDANPVRDLLAAEKFAEYEQYRDSVPDRMLMRELRSRLDTANALSDEQAESLVTAVGDERKQYEAEVRATGRFTSVFGSRSGSLMAAPQASGQDSPSDAEILSSAQDYADRLHRRAAEILTIEQMRPFGAIQGEQLERWREMLRDKPDARVLGQ